jgi:hypothetical protein
MPLLKASLARDTECSVPIVFAVEAEPDPL